jgi:serine/threonine protein phosphatase PrpC
MTVNTLSKLPYSKYEQAEYSHQPFYNICGYAFNSYNGKVRGYNEDRTKTIVDYRKPINVNGKTITPRVSYFGVFDGHGGEGCSNFLNNQFDSLLFNSKYFPAYPIQAVKEAFMNAENIFMQKAIDKNRNQLVDKSGSCACVMLIINNILYAINLGDSRALLSSDSGQNLRQITRDHKPNDPIEKARIEKSGAQVYYANKIISNGKEIVLKESNYGPGFKFPYRINPGGISVSFILLII